MLLVLFAAFSTQALAYQFPVTYPAYYYSSGVIVIKPSQLEGGFKQYMNVCAHEYSHYMYEHTNFSFKQSWTLLNNQEGFDIPYYRPASSKQLVYEQFALCSESIYANTSRCSDKKNSMVRAIIDFNN